MGKKKKTTTRKYRDYHSSDYGNEEEEDYGQDYQVDNEDDDFEQEDDENLQSARRGTGARRDSSDYDSDGGAEGARGSNTRRENGRGKRQDPEEQEDTFDDEDPFNPEIDLIVADKQVFQAFLPQQTPAQGQRGPLHGSGTNGQGITQNIFLVKFVDQSYLHLKWMSEEDLEAYSPYKARQKIRRYFQQKEKKRFIQELQQRQALQFKAPPPKPKIVAVKRDAGGSSGVGKGMNHHFSDDEDEDEQNEGALPDIDNFEVPAITEGGAEQGQSPSPVETKKPQFIEVLGPDREDLTQYFDKTYTSLERILSTTSLFAVIHPRQAKAVLGKWQDDCLKVVNVLANVRKNNVSLGLAFAEQLDPDNEDLLDYFKVVKTPIDFIMIMNRLYNRTYQQPQEFWHDLGLVFRNCRSYYKSQKIGLRKQCDAMRCLAFHLYKDWHAEQRTRFTTGIAIPVSQKKIGGTGGTGGAVEASQGPAQPTQAGVTGASKAGEISTKINLQSLLSGAKQQPESKPPVQLTQPVGQQQVPPPAMQGFNQPLNPTENQPMKYNNNQGLIDLNLGNNQMQLAQNQMFLGQQSQQINNNWIQGSLQNQLALQQQHQQKMFPQAPVLPSFASLHQQQMPIDPNQFALGGGQRALQLPSLNQIGQQGLLVQPSALGLMPGNNPFQTPSALQGYNQLGNPMSGLQFNMALQQQQHQLQLQNQQQQQQQAFNQYVQLVMQQNIPYAEKQALVSQMLQQQQQQQQQLISNQQALATIQGLGGTGIDLQGFMGQPQVSDYAVNHLINNLRAQNMAQAGQLPTISQIQGLNPLFGAAHQQQQQTTGIHLPSIAQITQHQQAVNTRGSQYGDPFSSLALQQQMGRSLALPGGGSHFMNTQDELSMMLGMQPYGQYGLPQQQQDPSYSTLSTRQHQTAHHNPRGPRVQVTSIIDPNLLQEANNNDNNFDKNDQQLVMPCIMDPGPFDLTWILDYNETAQDLEISPYLTAEEIEAYVEGKNSIDQLFLVKWRGLSYTQSTWEPESALKGYFDDKIQDFGRNNRSLDQFQRERLDHLIKNHKKMLRVTEKKYSGHGNKKVDPQQESLFSLQEVRLNRQLLNMKIQEIMGDAFYQVVQYSESSGIVPTFKRPHQRLKDYQVVGLNWLIRAWHEHRNVVLADEMGLGKTIMTLSLFDHLNKVYKLRGPYLILAPLTTLEHWKRIADEWTSLNSVLYYDPNSAEGRQEIRQWEWFYTDITYKGTITQKSELFKFNILITSFEVFMSDLHPILQEIPFIYIVVDEAHRLKNKQAKTLKLLKEHPCKRILLLTGTPVQNNTRELWTLLNYIEPEKFNDLDTFMEEYGALESYEQIQKLHTILKPHFLRRMKDEVENSIPPLNETVVEVGLTSLQNTYYKGIYGENRMVLAKFGTNSIKSSQLNNMDVQLRKCCNHLFLLKGVEEELTRECKNEEDLYNKLLESSGKLMLLDKFIEKFKKENHKMLIFSQFKRMLDIIELYLKMKGVPYEKLTGSVKTQDRIAAIQRFNDDKTPSGEGGGNGFGVFLLTTRAGGLGINLTSARVVIIFDSDWNPQNDLQAIARAHRIGQRFEVQVYRLITSKTYEEQMFERASKKLGMEQAIFSKGSFNPGMEDPAVMQGALKLKSLAELKQDAKEIESLLKYGAYAFMDNQGSGEDEMVNLKNKDIDEILATGKRKEFSLNKGVYTLQKSSFNASKYEKGALPDVNDPDFWNKVLPYQSIMSISMLDKKFKKEKKELSKNEKEQIEFIKDLEVVFNDFIDAKFDEGLSAASKKQLESDEELLREMLKKMIKLSGMKYAYVERCKEWLREMLRTSKRKKPQAAQSAALDEGDAEKPECANEDDIDNEVVEDDDIMMYDSDQEVRSRPIRKRNPPIQSNFESMENEAAAAIVGRQSLAKREPKTKAKQVEALVTVEISASAKGQEEEDEPEQIDVPAFEKEEEPKQEVQQDEEDVQIEANEELKELEIVPIIHRPPPQEEPRIFIPPPREEIREAQLTATKKEESITPVYALKSISPALTSTLASAEKAILPKKIKIDTNYDPDFDLDGSLLGRRPRPPVQYTSVQLNPAETQQDLIGEGRYGLRGRNKRIRDDREEQPPVLQAKILTYQQSSLSIADKVESNQHSRTNLQPVKRNEKNGIVCGLCLKPETSENPCPWFCQSYCQRSFHDACKEQLYGSGSLESQAKMAAWDLQAKRRGLKQPNLESWKCDDCFDNVAECFCCKKKGYILVFPKKGKPRAPGCPSYTNDQPANPSITSQSSATINNIQVEDALPHQPSSEQQAVQETSSIQQIEEKIQTNEQAQEQQKEVTQTHAIQGYNCQEAPLIKVLNDQEMGIADQDAEKPNLPEAQPVHKEQDVMNQEAPNQEEHPDKVKEKPEEQPEEAKEVNTNMIKIVIPRDTPDLNDYRESNDAISQDEKDLMMAESEDGNVEIGDEPDPNDPKYVVRCTLGGCFKYYHVKCVYQNKNVSCINSMKVQRFRCPLHYCEICLVSGDSVLIVQCVACPTAYHLKCMPKGDPNAIRLTKKYIVCSKHNLNPDDFPRYDEKSNTYNTISKLASSSALAAASFSDLVGEGKPQPKKRGRKPRSYYLALEEAAALARLNQAKIERKIADRSILLCEEGVEEEEDKEPQQHHNPGRSTGVNLQQRGHIQEEEDDFMKHGDMRRGVGIGMEDDDDFDDDFEYQPIQAAPPVPQPAIIPPPQLRMPTFPMPQNYSFPLQPIAPQVHNPFPQANAAVGSNMISIPLRLNLTLPQHQVQPQPPNHPYGYPMMNTRPQ